MAERGRETRSHRQEERQMRKRQQGVKERFLADGTRVFDAYYSGPGPDGRPKKYWRRGFRTEREAAAWRTKQLTTVHEGTHTEPSRRTLGEYLAEWLAGHRASVRGSTWASYSANLEGHVVARIGGVRLQLLTAATLNSLYAFLLAEGRSNGRGGLSARTVRYIHTVLHKALADAVASGLIVRNPADLAKPPAAKATRARAMRTWTPEELRSFLGHVLDSALYPAFLLASTTGMRRGEVLGFRWRDLDLDAGRASVRQAVISVGYRVSVSEPKSGKGRSIDLDPETVRTLREHRKRQFAAGAVTATGLVFCHPDGSPIHPDRFSKVFDGLVRSSGLPRIRLHDLRHTHATHLLGAAVHPKIVQERLGHSSIAITLDTYSHVTPALQREAADVTGALLFG
jgi:integrase